GLSSIRNDRARYKKWISPLIGAESIATIPRRRIEEVVQSLDRAVQLGQLRWKTAINVWGVLSKMMKDASRSKVIELRVREDNPAREVQGPDRGVERAGPYLFPSDFLALMDCDRVPARWKRLIMLATYLYVRVGELEALEWDAVDFEHGYVLIHQSAHADTGVVKPTKTKDVRKVPIEPNLRPLLECMRDQASSEGRVIAAFPPRESLAKRLRKYLSWAGVTRAELFAEDETRRTITFHDLRHTGITWRAVRGDEPLKVQRAAGHDDLATTQRYINEAQTFEGVLFGQPFPPVAISALVGFGLSFGVLATAMADGVGFSHESLRPQGDSNPR
ncbi:MAG: site-specific integrase, partial [Polyangiaceae bacterium]